MSIIKIWEGERASGVKKKNKTKKKIGGWKFSKINDIHQTLDSGRSENTRHGEYKIPITRHIILNWRKPRQRENLESSQI